MKRWRDVLAEAAHRHGVVTRRALLDAGLSEGGVDRLVADGRLVVLSPGSYQIAGSPDCLQARVLGVIDSLDGQAWASHRTAARLHGVKVHGPAGVIDILRLNGLSARHAGVQVHRTTRLLAHHVTMVDRVPVTTVPRTIFDLARRTGPKVLDRAVEHALRDRLCTVGSLYRVLAEMGGRGRPGTVKMRNVLVARGRDYIPTKSDMELVGRALLDDVPGIEWEVPMSDERGFIRSVDGRVAAAHLVVEFDGRTFHGRPADVDRDAAEDARLVVLGNVVQRLTWADLTVRAEATRALIDRLVQGGAA
ncbi:MAG TPA: type IV toxin-antitoxin system AbiEi family antitoxin domain-containing protein [Iamia sp.]